MNFTCNGLFYLPWLPGHHFVCFMVRSVLELERGSAWEAYPIYIRGSSVKQTRNNSCSRYKVAVVTWTVSRFIRRQIQIQTQIQKKNTKKCKDKYLPSSSWKWIGVVWGLWAGLWNGVKYPGERGGLLGVLRDRSSFYGKSTYLKRGSWNNHIFRGEAVTNTEKI